MEIQQVTDRQRELSKVCQDCRYAKLGEYYEFINCNANEFTPQPCKLSIETASS